MFSVIYGYTVQDQHDSFVRRGEDAINYFCTTIEPGAYTVDTFPFRKPFRPIQVLVLILPSEAPTGVVSRRWFQKNCKGVARAGHRLIRGGLQICTRSKGLWVSNICIHLSLDRQLWLDRCGSRVYSRRSSGRNGNPPGGGGDHQMEFPLSLLRSVSSHTTFPRL